MRKLLIILMILSMPVSAHALDTGELTAAEQYSFEIDPSFVDWATPADAETSNDSYATATYDALGSDTVPTNYLYLTVYGASIPSDATINGIEVKIERKCNT